jgi:hypothetical protein
MPWGKYDEEKELKQWHPLFLKSIKEALKDAEPGQLEIIDEVSLSSKPPPGNGGGCKRC